MNPPSFDVYLRGSIYRGMQVHKYVEMLETGYPLTAVREPTNVHDASAIRLEDEGIHVGYVDRENAAQIAPWMDRGWFFVSTLLSRQQSRRTSEMMAVKCAVVRMTPILPAKKTTKTEEFICA